MRREMYRRAANGEGQLMTYYWTGDSPKGIVQIVHDQGTHTLWNEEFATALQEAGYDVYANDLIGHGMSNQGHPGAFGMRKGGFGYLVEDVHALFEFAGTNSGKELPHILIGIGLGSLISMRYMTEYGDVDQLILMEVPDAPRAAGLIRMRARDYVRRYGYQAVSESISDLMLQTGTVRRKRPHNRYFWLSTDPDMQKAYEEDPNCGTNLAASACLEIVQAFHGITKKTVAQIPDIPVVILSGTEDQIGDCGKAPGKWNILFTKTGHSQVDLMLYPGAVHDILHDTCREQVTGDILTWMEHKQNSAE